MTDSEINAFLAKAAAAFEGVRRALTSPPETDQQGRHDFGVRVQLWRSTLADVDAADAERCLQAIHRGEAGDSLKFPSDWADQFPKTVRRWCRDHAVPQAPTAAKWGEPQRFRCLDCRDTGMVSVLSPAYVAAHRHLFEIESPAIDPMDKARMDELRAWYRDARRWCRSRNVGPFEASVVCSCDNRIAQAKRQAITEHRNGCVFNQALMPVLDSHGPIGAWEACVEFVNHYSESESHDLAHAWQP